MSNRDPKLQVPHRDPGPIPAMACSRKRVDTNVGYVRLEMIEDGHRSRTEVGQDRHGKGSDPLRHAPPNSASLRRICEPRRLFDGMLT